MKIRRWALIVSILLAAAQVHATVTSAAEPEPDRPVSAASVAPSVYQGLSPARLMDTRTGRATVDGQSAGGGAVGPDRSVEVTVSGRGGVPGIGVDSVVANVTVDQPTADGFVTVWAAGTARPTASNVNFAKGATVANLVVAKIGDNGKISVYNYAGSSHVVVDVLGWFPIGASYTTVAPARLMDTRTGRPTVDGLFSGIGAIAGNATTNLIVTGRGGVPLTGAGAVAVNITVDQPTAGGFVTAWPAGQSQPNASNVNFAAGQTVANLAVIPVGAGGAISLFNFAGASHIIVDVLGYSPSPQTFTGLAPARLADTRSGRQTIDGRNAGGGAVGADSVIDLPVAGRGGVPLSGAGSVIVNVTVDQPTEDGFLTVWPSGGSRPNASNVNFTRSKTVANLAVVRLGSNGAISIYNFAGSSHVVVDVLGYFPTGAQSPTESLSAGGSSTCAILAASGGLVRCWGFNSNGQIGNAGVANGASVALPTLVTGLTGATAVSVGGQHACAILIDDTVRCWGFNDDGELGNGGFGQSSTPVTVSGLTGAVSISAGQNHTCAIVAGASVKCWGAGNLGQLGNGSTTAKAPTPVTVSGISTAIAISARGSHTCAVLSDHTARCWGYGANSQLGNGSTDTQTTPVVVTGLTNVAGISTSTTGSCAWMIDGTWMCWGSNLFGELGPTILGASSVPVSPTASDVLVSSVAMFGDHTCVLLLKTTVWCMGRNQFGELGNGGNTNTDQLVRAADLVDVRAVTVGAFHSCALFDLGVVRCWGSNASGQLGNGTLNPGLVPTVVTGLVIET